MFEHECKLYAFVLYYARQLTADIDDAQLAEQPAPGMNHPAWIIGHLAICTDYAAMTLGLEKTCPEAWHKMFGPGSTLTTNRSDYPSKAELIERAGGRPRTNFRRGAQRGSSTNGKAASGEDRVSEIADRHDGRTLVAPDDDASGVAPGPAFRVATNQRPARRTDAVRPPVQSGRLQLTPTAAC